MNSSLLDGQLDKDHSMPREIKTYPDPILQKKADKIETVTQDIQDLAKEMIELMYANQGIGLAAPQVGESLCLITVDVSGPEKRQNLQVVINPEIVEGKGEMISEEGCLSLPEFKTKVKRCEEVTITGLDLQGRETTIHTEGLQAVCFQHEIDHLQGTVLLDHAGSLKKNMYRKKVKRWEKN